MSLEFNAAIDQHPYSFWVHNNRMQLLRHDGQPDPVPFPYFAPASATANVVDRGMNVGLPFLGAAPDLGALEYGQTPWQVGLP